MKRGEVFIAPVAFFPADGRMVNPGTSWFSVSWQNDAGGEGTIERDDVFGAGAGGW
jgi:hypothetical protein